MVLSLLFTTSLSSLWFSNYYFFSLLSSPWALPTIHGYLTSFILLDSMGFLPFVPKALPTVFGFLWASLQDYPPTCWLPGHYFYSECACCTTLHSKTKLFVLFLPPPPSFSALPKWIRIEGSLPTYPYGMHQVAPALCLPLFG